MLQDGRQRGLFVGLLGLGVVCLLLLDVVFAPAALEADVQDGGSDAAKVEATLVVDAAVPQVSRHIPAIQRVPTIVARFDRESKEPADQSAIRALAAAMIEEHDAKIVLEGHSDTVGAQDYNTDLSLERAEWVKSRLVNLGISGDRIATEGLGSTRPLHEDLDAQAMNRRVEVRWLGK